MAKFEFPYTPSPKNVPELLDKIQTIGMPKGKVNLNYLKSLGFKSSYDTYLPPVLKFLGFVNADGSPTSIWQQYGVKKQARSVMASAIKNAYSVLFHTYEDAYAQTNTALVDFFKARTGASDTDAGLLVQTFQNLCALADFEAAPAEAPVSEPTVPLTTKEEAARIPTVMTGLTVNINIQLTLPVTDDESVYDKLFASLKRNLLS
jgi:hypothetical protein